MIRAYVRCSTNETKQDLERQVRELQKQFQIDKVYKEYQSGSKLDREQYGLLLSEVKLGDSIVSTEVSRLSRSTKQFMDLLELVKERKVKLSVGNMTIDCSAEGKMDIMTETTLKIMSVFSELERQMISERVKSGMENARAKGVKLGRPRTSAEDIPARFLETYELYKRGKLNVTDLAKLNKKSRTTVYKYIGILDGTFPYSIEPNLDANGRPYEQLTVK